MRMARYHSNAETTASTRGHWHQLHRNELEMGRSPISPLYAVYSGSLKRLWVVADISHRLTVIACMQSAHLSFL